MQISVKEVSEPKEKERAKKAKRKVKTRVTSPEGAPEWLVEMTQKYNVALSGEFPTPK